MHGLRPLYAQTRYEELTGWKAPVAGGPTASMLNHGQRMLDHNARYELGHERPEITAVHLGR